MNDSKSDFYASAGVDITAGYRAVELMKKHVRRTLIPGADDDIGGFGGTFVPDLAGMRQPVLVSGTDGVGTKIKIAFDLNKHDTVGIDCVAMCVNDIICCGAKPLFFLDYIACGRNIPEKIAAIVGGVAEGCVRSGCALIGGETAEHPGLMPEEEYDLAGFAVGIVDRERVLKPDSVREGDAIIALPSSGVHSNGFSLVRKILAESGTALGDTFEELDGRPIGEVLLTPTKLYVKPVLALLDAVAVKSVAHITGGGFYENIPRALPEGLGAKIDRASLRVLPIFGLLARLGNVPEREMFNVYNMGVGMTVIVAPEDAAKAVEVLRAGGEDAYVCGEVVRSDTRMELC